MSESGLKLFHIDDDGDYSYWVVAKDIEELRNEILPGYDLDGDHLDIGEWGDMDSDFPLRIYFPDGVDEDSELPSEPTPDPDKRNILYVEAPVSEWIKVSKSGDMIACWGL